MKETYRQGKEPLNKRILNIPLRIKCPECGIRYKSLYEAIGHSYSAHNDNINIVKLYYRAYNVYLSSQNIPKQDKRECWMLMNQTRAKYDEIIEDRKRMQAIKERREKSQEEMRRRELIRKQKEEERDLARHSRIGSSWDGIGQYANIKPMKFFSSDKERIVNGGIPYSSRKRF